MVKKTFGRAAAVLLAAVLASFAVSGCGGSSAGSGGAFDSSSAQSYMSGAGYEAAPTAAAETSAASAYDYDGGLYGYEVEEDESGYENADSAEVPMPMEPDGTAGDTDSSGTQANLRANRKLIRTVNMDVETTEFDALLANITQAVNEDGGYIEQSDVSGNSMTGSGSGRRRAYITIRIPSARLDGFLDQVSEQSNVTNRSESVEDVTLQYTDVESRKKSLTIEQERLWALLEKADSVDSIIALESRLSEIRYELEKYESRLRTYDNQVEYSTLYLDIREVGVFTPTEPDSVMTRIQKGFMRNLDGLATGAVDLFVALVSSLPSIAVLVMLLALLWLVMKKVRRKNRKKVGFRLHLPGRKRTEERPESKAAESVESEAEKKAAESGKSEAESKAAESGKN